MKPEFPGVLFLTGFIFVFTCSVFAAGPVDHFQVSPSKTSMSAGDIFTVAVIAKDSGNTTVDTYTGLKNLTSTLEVNGGVSNGISPNGTTPAGLGTISVQFNSGTATGLLFRLVKTEAGVTLKITDASIGKYGITQPLTIASGDCSAFNVTAVPGRLIKAGTTSIITAVLTDVYGNPITGFSGTFTGNFATTNVDSTLTVFSPVVNGSAGATFTAGHATGKYAVFVSSGLGLESSVTIEVAVDPPATAVIQNSEVFSRRSVVYVYRDTPVKLNVTSGNGQPFTTYYRIDNGSTLVYAPGSSFTLGEPVNQARCVYYYSVDDQGNTEGIHTEKFFVMKAQVAPGTVKIWPNPFNPANDVFATIGYTLTRDSEIKITIYDLLGNVVWTKTVTADDDAGQVASGTGKIIRWDGTNDSGTTVANGGYICLIKIKNSDGEETHKFKIAVVK